MINEVSPPGFKGTVRAMQQKEPQIDNAFALSWFLKKQGAEAHYKDKAGKPEKKAKYKNETFEEYVTRMDESSKRFPVAAADLDKAGGSKNTFAVPTGEFRPPRKGEWYLSGSQPEAYYASNDSPSPYYIVRLGTTFGDN